MSISLPRCPYCQSADADIDVHLEKTIFRCCGHEQLNLTKDERTEYIFLKWHGLLARWGPLEVRPL